MKLIAGSLQQTAVCDMPLCTSCFQYSHKKWKNSLEIEVERAVRSAYAENQPILELIPLYRTSK